MPRRMYQLTATLLIAAPLALPTSQASQVLTTYQTFAQTHRLVLTDAFAHLRSLGP